MTAKHNHNINISACIFILNNENKLKKKLIDIHVLDGDVANTMKVLLRIVFM